MDSATFFAVVTVLVAVILVAIGVYLVLLIHEAHQSLKRVNKILTRLDHLSSFLEHSVARPAAGLTNLSALVQEGLTFVNDVRRATHHKKEREPEK